MVNNSGWVPGTRGERWHHPPDCTTTQSPGGPTALPTPITPVPRSSFAWSRGLGSFHEPAQSWLLHCQWLPKCRGISQGIPSSKFLLPQGSPLQGRRGLPTPSASPCKGPAAWKPPPHRTELVAPYVKCLLSPVGSQRRGREPDFPVLPGRGPPGTQWAGPSA